MEKDKRRATRRSREAKALQHKQYRQRIIKNKKKYSKETENEFSGLPGFRNNYREETVDDEIQIRLGTVHEFLERDDLQGEVLPHGSGDLGDTSEDTSS